MTLLEKLVESYTKNNLKVEVKDTPDWMGEKRKLVIVKRPNSEFIMILHLYDEKTDKIVANF